MSRQLPAEGTEDWKAIRAIMANWFFVNGLGGARPDDGIQTHERITFRRMIVRLRIDYPRLDEYRDGSLALVFWQALFGLQSPPATTTEALQRRVFTPAGAFVQIERRQWLQREADRLASLGQLPAAIWHDDAAQAVTFAPPFGSDFGLTDWMRHA